MTNLDKELKTLTRPVELGIALGIPQYELEIIERDNPLGRTKPIVANFFACDVYYFVSEVTLT